MLFGEDASVELLTFELSLYGQSTEPLLRYLPSEVETRGDHDLIGIVSGQRYYEASLHGPRARLKGIHTRAGSPYPLGLPAPPTQRLPESGAVWLTRNWSTNRRRRGSPAPPSSSWFLHALATTGASCPG